MKLGLNKIRDIRIKYKKVYGGEIMKYSDKIVNQYITYFFNRIVGFEKQEAKYMMMPNDKNEYISIVMDKVHRLTRKSGRLRSRVWSNCIFILNNKGENPSYIIEEKIKQIKKETPFLFVRSYVYFIFIDVSSGNQLSLLGDEIKIKTSDYQIWIFNSNYEVKVTKIRTNLFGIALNDKEIIDDYMYLTNPEVEIQRMQAANSDAIDCVRAFTGDLELLEQTNDMLIKVNAGMERNPNARFLVEGPARSGKTIIATSLLGKYEDSKFLIMNYFFYKAIVDGFHALSGWSKEEIDSLVKNPELESWVNFKKLVQRNIKRITKNLEYAIRECDTPKKESNTKKWLIQNIKEIIMAFDDKGLDYKDYALINFLNNFKRKVEKSNNKAPFKNIKKEKLQKLNNKLISIQNGNHENLKDYEEIIIKSIEEIIRNSKQRFFHHDINKKKSSAVKDGCWIVRGNPTISKMWTGNYKPSLIICDEVQRLGIISEYPNGTYDEFDEVREIITNSKMSFFTGDNFQMLNHKYDQGIDRIQNTIKESAGHLKKIKLPASVGIPNEIGLLMKWLTNPNAVNLNELVSDLKEKRMYEITILNNSASKMVEIFDKDSSNKKHFAAPMDWRWMNWKEKITINTNRRVSPIIRLGDHEKENFAYKFPYFCNEEIMPNFILSAYELISREVESLYVHIPKFSNGQPFQDEFYKKHLYVLFTRPTSKLVINFEHNEEFSKFKKLIDTLKNTGVKVPIKYI